LHACPSLDPEHRAAALFSKDCSGQKNEGTKNGDCKSITYHKISHYVFGQDQGFHIESNVVDELGLRNQYKELFFP